MKESKQNREQWLQAAVTAMTPLFEQHGYKVPPVRVSCGWPSTRGVGTKSYTLGECWPQQASEDKVAQIFINPRERQAASKDGVLATLVHEVVHAVVGCKEGHNKVFGKCARLMGLEGKLTATIAGAELVAKLVEWTKKLGDYPHAQLKPGFRLKKKQTTRLVKCECEDCGYNVRVTRKWLEAGAPLCPCNQKPMAFEIPDELEEDENE